MNDDVIEIVKKSYESFLPVLQEVNWKDLTKRYKQFLGNIPLSTYRENLQKIKTVEFDLSGKYRSFHLSLIYHLYWKRKFITLIDSDLSARYKTLKNICNLLVQAGGRIPLYWILGQFGFNTEEQFVKWLHLKEYSNGIRPINFITIEQEPLSNDEVFPSFEDFWKEYKDNIDLNDFIIQHQNFIDINKIKSQIIHEIKNNNIFTLLKEEDIETEKTDELIKGYILVGLKARIYRTWVSLLTQLDLSYTWNKTISSKMDSDVILDLKGIDIYGKVNNFFIGIQIKKRSRRHEALKIVESETPIKTIHIPYDLNFENDEYLRDKLTKLGNNFVVFTENYVTHIYEQISQGENNDFRNY